MKAGRAEKTARTEASQQTDREIRTHCLDIDCRYVTGDNGVDHARLGDKADEADVCVREGEDSVMDEEIEIEGKKKGG